MKDDWFPRQENSEDFANSLHQRTEELYRIPDGLPDENGLIECAVLMLRDIVVFPRMVSPIFISPSPNLLAIQEAQIGFQTMVALVQKDPDAEDARPARSVRSKPIIRSALRRVNMLIHRFSRLSRRFGDRGTTSCRAPVAAGGQSWRARRVAA